MTTAQPLGDHIIIGGCGHLGSGIADECRRRGIAVTVVDLQSPTGSGDLPVVLGDITDDLVLREAGIATARCVIIVTGDDRANLEAAMSARQLRPDVRIIVRLFDQSLAQCIETALGVQVLSAAWISAPAFVAAATEHTMVATFEVDGQRLHLYRGDASAAGEMGVGVQRDGTRLMGCAPDAQPWLYASPSARFVRPVTRRQIRWADVCAACAELNPMRLLQAAHGVWRHAPVITRGLLTSLLSIIIFSVVLFSTFGRMAPVDAFYFVVTTLTTVGYGDFNLQAAPPALKLYGALMMLCGAGLLATAYAMISDYVLTARMEYLLGRRAVELQEHIIIVGLGKVGYRVAQMLQTLGYPVATVEANEDSDTVQAARLVMPVIIGNAVRASVLLKAGVAHAGTILALTDDPMVNLSVLLHAREANPHIRTIMRTYERSLAHKLQHLQLHTVISTSALAAPVFVNAALYPGVEGSFTLDDATVLVMQHIIEADSPWCGRTVADLGETEGMAVVMIGMPGAQATAYRVARPADTLQAGQRLVLLLLEERLPVLTAV